MCHSLPVCGATLHLPSSWKSNSPLKFRHFLAGPLTLVLPELLSPTLVPLEETVVEGDEVVSRGCALQGT